MINMKKVTYDLVIDSISSIHGEYPGSVDVSFHREGGDLKGRDGFETKRVPLSDEVINKDGTINDERLNAEIEFAIGGKEIVEVED